MSDYYKEGQPIMPEILRTYKPKFLIANIASLDLEKLGDRRVSRRLLPIDEAILKTNYIRHWGPIYVPGKRFEFKANQIKKKFNVIIDGNYTLESEFPVQINGTTVNPNEVSRLSVGTHFIRSVDAEKATLRWGDNLMIPTIPAPKQRVFRGF